MNPDEDLLGDYYWEFSPVSDLDLFNNTDAIGQYGKFRMAVEEILAVEYKNGVLSINDKTI